MCWVLGLIPGRIPGRIIAVIEVRRVWSRRRRKRVDGRVYEWTEHYVRVFIPRKYLGKRLYLVVVEQD